MLHKVRILNGPKPSRPARVYFVPHNRSWYAIPLSAPGSVELPGEPPRTRLHFGDELTVGGLSLEVEEATVADAAPLEPGDGGTVCRFEVAGRGGALASADVTLIGSAPHCDFVLPDEFGVAPVHAAFARVEGRWVIYDVLAVTSPGTPWTALRDGDRVRVGPLEFKFEIFHADELEVASTDTISLVAAGDTAPEPRPGEVAMPPADPRRGVSLGADRGQGFGSALSSADARAATPRQPARTRARGLRPVEGVGRPRPPARRPHDKSVLGRYTQFLADSGYAGLYRLMARRVFDLDQADPHAAAAVAEAYLVASREPGLDAEERCKRLAEAERFATVAADLSRGSPRFEQLRATVAVETTLSRMQRPTSEVGR